jgi:hypothetical protein
MVYLTVAVCLTVATPERRTCLLAAAAAVNQKEYVENDIKLVGHILFLINIKSDVKLKINNQTTKIK